MFLSSGSSPSPTQAPASWGIQSWFRRVHPRTRRAGEGPWCARRSRQQGGPDVVLRQEALAGSEEAETGSRAYPAPHGYAAPGRSASAYPSARWCPGEDSRAERRGLGKQGASGLERGQSGEVQRNQWDQSSGIYNEQKPSQDPWLGDRPLHSGVGQLAGSSASCLALRA